MKTLKYILPLIILTLSLGLTSCKKKCVVEADTINGGSIVKDVIFYPESGYMTGNMGGDYSIDASHQYANKLQVSIGGAAKTNVNYNNYTVLCYPISAKCNAAYDRSVTIDNINQTVVYKIVVTQCANCEEVRMTENYVLVPAFPSNYTVLYDISYIDK
jgi:hypothetical protein